MKIGIVGAMPEEMEKVLSAIVDKSITEIGNRLYYEGTLCGISVVGVFSRWGKVAAAVTVANLIQHFGVDRIFFTGIAGAVSDDLSVGDVVVAERLFQHDMDARPLMRRFEIPLTGKTSFEIRPEQVNMCCEAVHNFLKTHTNFRIALAENGITSPHLVKGDIASGDLFISSETMRKTLNRNLPSVLCVDMESAAAAQVCDDFQVSCCVIRVISDAANEQSSQSACDFVVKHGGDYSLGIVMEYLKLVVQDE